MGTFSNVKKQNLSTIKFKNLWLAHPGTLETGEIASHKKFPCNPVLYKDQCAVRLSTAAIKAGITFFDYPENTCEGTGTFSGSKYARGAESLANFFLMKFGFNSRKLFLIMKDRYLAKSTKEMLFLRKGIIFFRNIQGFQGGSGDHIDLWNGEKTISGEYFNESDEIWFWEMKK